MNNEFNNNQPMNSFNNGVNPQPGFNPAPANNVNPGVPSQPVNPGYVNQNYAGQQNATFVNQPMPNQMGMQNPGYPPQAQPVKNNQTTKYILIGVGAAVLLIVILLVTGVLGGKKLTCTMTEDMYGMKMTQEMKFHFSGDKVNKITGKNRIEFEDPELLEGMGDMIEELEEEMVSEFEDTGAKTNVTSDDKSVTVTFSMGKDSLEENFGMDPDEEVTIEEVKEEFESQGYTCK